MSRGGAPSRSQQAFSWLLSGDNDGDRSGGAGRAGAGRGSRRQSGGGDSRAAGRRRGSGGRAPYIPGFQLREDAATAAGRPAGLAATPLQSLQGAFDGVLPGEVVADVLAACSGDAGAATEVLLSMTGGGGGGGAGEDAGAAATSSAGATAAGGKPAVGPDGAPAAPAAPAGPCYLEVLPEELKGLIFQQLSLRDLARAARACREFAEYVRQQRRSLRTVAVPEGVSHTAVRGLVASFAGAPGVSLTRCAAQLRLPHEFEAMLRAVALGESDRPASGVPISHLSLSRCPHGDDATVATICDTFAGLTRLDMSRCTEVGDGGVQRLAAYTRVAPSEGSGSSSGGDNGSEDEAGWVASGSGGGGADAPAAAAAAGVESMQLTPRGGGLLAPAQGAPVPGLESPSSAVQRIAEERHAAMMARSAAAAREQHGQPLARGLEELCLKETSVSGRGCKALLQPGSATSKSLRLLDVSRCPNVGGDALDLHPRCVLEDLRAQGCCALRSVVIQLPPEAPLRALQLDGCRQLHELVVVVQRLQSLNVSHCGQLRAVSLRCRRLRELRAVNCGSLNLAASELHCPGLKEVNLFGCRQVDAEGLESAAASLVACERLDLTGCTSLSRVLLPDATALRSVSLGGCGVLRQVLLASPALSELRAAGCGRLMELRLGSASLTVLDLENCGHLREVQLSSGEGAASRAQRHEQEGARPTRKLVLRGCVSLSQHAKQRLRGAVLGQ